MANAHSNSSRRLGLRLWNLVPLVLLMYYGFQIALRSPGRSPVHIAAHRGGASLAPENTMAAFRAGIEAGADALEFDVQRSRDGVLVVMHDETVDRTTNGRGAVRDLTLAQLRALDAGGGERVPTFDEVIDLARQKGIPIMPEAKSPDLYPGMEAEMLATLRRSGYLDHALIQSFSAGSLQRLRAAEPTANLCALQGLWDFDVRSPAGNADAVCPMAEMILLDPAMIRAAHAEGREVFAWFLVIENPATLRILRFFGADGFIVNDPAAARRALRP